MIDLTSRNPRRGTKAVARLDQLTRQAREDTSVESSSLPPDQTWLDVSLDAQPTRKHGWWADVGPAPPDEAPPTSAVSDLTADPTSARGRDASREPERAGIALAPPTEAPWWRRQMGRLLERWLPDPVAERPRWRLAVVAVIGAVVLGIAVAFGLVMSARSGQAEAPPALPAAAVGSVTPSASTSPSTGAGRSIVVSVVGRVKRPGLVTLPDGSRVADALKATGGAARGAAVGGLNLARRLTDGEQIYVGIPPPPNAEPPGAAAGTGKPGADIVDLNSASLAALDTLPGVGPVTAQRIVDWRTEHGRFASVDQLRDVDGIGPTRFKRLKDLVVAR